MILPPLAEDYNERFPTITQPYFDDHQARREHSIQLRLKQHAPVILDGGRAILWFCRLCQKPWYQLGRTASYVCLSTSQLAEIAEQQGAEMQTLFSLPSSMCPLCAALHLGGMPRVEEYLNGRGYRFFWDGITRQQTRLFCIVYNWNVGSISDVLREACATHCDVLSTPMEDVKRVVDWLKTLAEPGKEEATMITESIYDHLSRLDPPKPGFSWCGYAWKSWCPFLG